MQVYNSDFVAYKTLVGKDGWLFVWDMDGLTEIVSGKTRHSPLQIQTVTRNIELRHHWCKANGIEYIHTIAPDKSSVYTKYLPDEVTWAEDGLLRQYTDALSRCDATFVDSWEIARSAALEGQAYFKTDSHWTYHTAYRVLTEMMAPVNKAFPLCKVLTPDQIVEKPRETIMELSALLPEPTKESSKVIAPKRSTTSLVLRTESARGRILVYENERKNLPTCIVFRDSFSSFFMDVLKESFSRVVAINSRVFWYDLVEREKPDVVFVEVAERFLDPVVTDLHVRSFEQSFNVSIETILEAGNYHG